MRAIFERLVTPERTRAVVSLSELRELPGNPDDIERLIYRLVDARLLVVEARAGDDRAAELVHESLIAGWPTLIGWLDENRGDAAFLARLRTAAAEWQASDHDDGVLWRDEPARQALAWLAHYRGELARRERAYLTRCARSPRGRGGAAGWSGADHRRRRGPDDPAGGGRGLL